MTTAKAKGPWDKNIVTVEQQIAQIQQEAGVQYAFPAGAVELQPGQEWTVDFGALTNAKRAKCGKSDE